MGPAFWSSCGVLLEGGLSLGSSHDEPELFNPKFWNNLEVRDVLSAYADGKMATESLKSYWKGGPAGVKSVERKCSVVTS